jgi:hypothetical protein
VHDATVDESGENVGPPSWLRHDEETTVEPSHEWVGIAWL